MPKSSTSIGKMAQILQQDLELSVLALALLSKLESLVTWMLTVVCLCSGSQLFAWFVVIFYVILKSCVESKAIRIACVMPKMVRFLGGWEPNFRARFWLFLHAWKNRCKKWFHEMFVGFRVTILWLHKEELQRRKKQGSSFYRMKTRNISVTVVFGKEPRSEACVIKLKYSLHQEEGRMKISIWPTQLNMVKEHP